MSRTAKRRSDDERVIKRRLRTPQNTRFIPDNLEAVWIDPTARPKLRDSKLIYRRCRCSWCMGAVEYKKNRGPQIRDYDGYNDGE